MRPLPAAAAPADDTPAAAAPHLACAPTRATAIAPSITVELAFLGNALKRLVRALDAILKIVTVRGKQLHDLIAIIGSHMPDRPGREVHRLADLEFVRFQHGTLELK